MDNQWGRNVDVFKCLFSFNRYIIVSFLYAPIPYSFLDAQFSKTLQKPRTAQIKLPTGGANIKYKKFLVSYLQPRIKNIKGIILLDVMPCMLKIICEVCESSLSANCTQTVRLSRIYYTIKKEIHDNVLREWLIYKYHCECKQASHNCPTIERPLFHFWWKCCRWMMILIFQVVF